MKLLLATAVIVSVLLLCLGAEVKRRDNEVNEGVKFYLVTLRNKKNPEQITEYSLRDTKLWTPEKPVVILIHSWMELGKESAFRPIQFQPLQDVKQAYLDMNRNVNIILVDWSKYSTAFDFKKVDEGIVRAGTQTGRLIVSINELGQLSGSFRSVHIIGFGAGAQAAGIAGTTVQLLSNGEKIGRITALDGGRFVKTDLSKHNKTRLDKSDAEFVVAIHCSILPYNFEKPNHIQSTAFGHVDFFPEAGIWQHGCRPLIQFFDIKYISATCSHLACPRLYAKSIRGYRFHGCRCADEQAFDDEKCDCDGPLMGEQCDKSARGNYFVETQSPSKMLK